MTSSMAKVKLMQLHSAAVHKQVKSHNSQTRKSTYTIAYRRIYQQTTMTVVVVFKKIIRSCQKDNNLQRALS